MEDNSISGWCLYKSIRPIIRAHQSKLNSQTMKNIFTHSIPVAILASIAAVSCYPQGDPATPESYDYLCTNVVIGIREHPESCDRYIACNKFEAQEVVCPEGQVFSRELILCVDGDPSGCLKQDPTEEVVTCPEGFVGRMPYPGDCGKFYNCADGTAKVETCFEGYIFYEQMKVCLPGYEFEGECKLHSLG